MAGNGCCTDPEIAFFFELEGGVPADGSPTDAVFQDILGVPEGTEGSRYLPGSVNECNEPHLAFAIGVAVTGD